MKRSSGVSPATQPVVEADGATDADPTLVETDDFSVFLHGLRSRELRKLPAGAQTVLSGGCAGAWYFDWFAENYPTPPARHIGVEAYAPRPESLPAEVEWLERPLGDLAPIGDGEVDLVFAGEVFEHLWPHEIVGFLAEAHRVLRTGGHVALDSPNRRVTSALAWIHPEHTVEFTVDEAVELLTLAGFDDVRVRGLWLCYDDERGSFLPLELDAGGRAWPRERRALEAEGRPFDSFVWWAEAVRSDREVDRRALEDRVAEIYRAVRPLALNRLRKEIGSLVESPSGSIVSAAPGESGILLRGPGVAMPPGEGSVTFWLGCPGRGTAEADAGAVLGAVELAAGSRIVASREVTSGDVARRGRLHELTLPYELPQTAFDVEVRVRSTGHEPLAALLRIHVDEGATTPSLSPPSSFDGPRGDLTHWKTARALNAADRRRSSIRRSPLRALGRVALWPVRRLLDPRVQGMLAHIDARHRELLARIDALDAQVESLALRLESLQAGQGAQDAGETAGDDSAE